MKRFFFFILMAYTAVSCSLLPPKKVFLHEMDLSKMEIGWGAVRANMSCDSNQQSPVDAFTWEESLAKKQYRWTLSLRPKFHITE